MRDVVTDLAALEKKMAEVAAASKAMDGLIVSAKDRPWAEIVAEKAPYYAKRITLFEGYRARELAKMETARAAGVAIKIVLPDGGVRAGVKGVTTPFDVANEISKSLAKKCVVAKVDGDTWDLHRPLEGDCALSLHSFDDAEGRDVSCSRATGRARAVWSPAWTSDRMEQSTGSCRRSGPCAMRSLDNAEGGIVTRSRRGGAPCPCLCARPATTRWLLPHAPCARRLPPQAPCYDTLIMPSMCCALLPDQPHLYPSQHKSLPSPFPSRLPDLLALECTLAGAGPRARIRRRPDDRPRPGGGLLLRLLHGREDAAG